MEYQEIKRALRFEYKTTTGQYIIIQLENDTCNWDQTKYVFDIRFNLNYKTFMFCNANVASTGHVNYEMTKITTFGFDGIVSEFNSIQDFVNYIGSLDNVEFIKPY